MNNWCDDCYFKCLKHLSGAGGATWWSKSHHVKILILGHQSKSMIIDIMRQNMIWHLKIWVGPNVTRGIMSYQCDHSWSHHNTCWFSKEQFITDVSLTEDISLYKYDMITSLIWSHQWYDHINMIINVIISMWPCVITS